MALLASVSVALAIFVRIWSDAIFLSTYGARWIPVLLVVSAVAFAPATWIYTRMAHRYGFGAVNTFALSVFFVLIAVCTQVPTGKAFVFAMVIALSLVTPLVHVIAWNTILEHVRRADAARLVPRLGGYSTGGAMLAGWLGALVVEAYGIGALLPIAACVLGVALPLCSALNREREAPARRDASGSPDRSDRSERPRLATTRVVRIVALATFMMALITSVVDFQFKVQLQQSLGRDDIGVFLSWFHAATNLVILVFQFAVVPRIMGTVGVASTYAFHPFVLSAGAALFVIAPSLAAASIWRFADTLFKFTFQSDAAEILLQPLDIEDRARAKAFVKGIIYPLGSMAAGLTLMLLSWDANERLISCVAGALAVVWLVLVRMAAHRARVEGEPT